VKRGLTKKALRKVWDGIHRYGLARTASGALTLLRLWILKPTLGTVSTTTDGLVIHFDYPDQCVPSLVVFNELMEPDYQFVRETLSRDSVFFDIGAGIGCYTLCAARIVDGPIHAFEPIPRNVRTIRANLRENALQSKVVLNPLALSATEGLGRMETPPDGDLFVSHLLELSSQPSDGDVEVTTLDSYCARKAVRHIDLLKIDAEGHEERILAGAASALGEGRIQAMILETDAALESFYRSLEEKGYQCFYYDPIQHRLRRVSPVSSIRIDTLRPSPFHSNMVLIHRRALKSYEAMLSPPCTPDVCPRS